MKINENAEKILTNYRWSGNVRQLRNVAEQISVLEKNREISPELIKSYLPNSNSQLPAIFEKETKGSDFSSEREILYKVLFDMKNDLNELKKITMKLMDKNVSQEEKEGLIQKIYNNSHEVSKNSTELSLYKEDSEKDNVNKKDSNNFEYTTRRFEISH